MKIALIVLILVISFIIIGSLTIPFVYATNQITCWYKEAGNCKTREYSKSLCSECGKGDCSSYMNFPLYNSQSTCNSAIECVNDCGLNGDKYCEGDSIKYCGNFDEDACFDLKTQVCPVGQTCANRTCIDKNPLVQKTKAKSTNDNNTPVIILSIAFVLTVIIICLTIILTRKK